MYKTLILRINFILLTHVIIVKSLCEGRGLGVLMFFITILVNKPFEEIRGDFIVHSKAFRYIKIRQYFSHQGFNAQKLVTVAIA